MENHKSNAIADLRGDAARWSRAAAARAASTPASAAAVPPPGSLPPAELRALGPAQPAAPPGAPAAAELLSANILAIMNESPPMIGESCIKDGNHADELLLWTRGLYTIKPKSLL